MALFPRFTSFLDLQGADADLLQRQFRRADNAPSEPNCSAFWESYLKYAIHAFHKGPNALSIRSLKQFTATAEQRRRDDNRYFKIDLAAETTGGHEHIDAGIISHSIIEVKPPQQSESQDWKRTEYIQKVATAALTTEKTNFVWVGQTVGLTILFQEFTMEKGLKTIKDFGDFMVMPQEEERIIEMLKEVFRTMPSVTLKLVMPQSQRMAQSPAQAVVQKPSITPFDKPTELKGKKTIHEGVSGLEVVIHGQRVFISDPRWRAAKLQGRGAQFCQDLNVYVLDNPRK